MERNSISFDVNSKGIYYFDIICARKHLIEMIDFAVENSKGAVFRENREIDSEEWLIVKEHWENAIMPNTRFGLLLGFKDKNDALIFYLKFKGFIDE